MLNSVARKGAPYLVFSATAGVYGNPSICH
ncbi:hypothetical protein [Methylocaldum gracile]